MIIIPSVLHTVGNSTARIFDLFSRLLQDRVIMLTGPIDDDQANLFIAELLHLEAENPDLPIHIYINSPGGSVVASLGMYDVMRYVKAPIITICVGQACSAASLLLCAGDKRFGTEHCRVLLHQPSAGFAGQASDLKIHINEIEILYDQVLKIYAAHTGLSKKKLVVMLDRDTIIRGNECIRLGIIDSIIQPNKPINTPIHKTNDDIEIEDPKLDLRISKKAKDVDNS